MAKKIVPENQSQHGTTSVCIPLYRLQVVKEPHSALYGAPRISDSHDVSRFLRAHFEGRPHEEFLVVFLDAKNTPVELLMTDETNGTGQQTWRKKKG